MRESFTTQVVDPGLDETIKKLTPEKIEQVVNHVLTKESAARLQVYIEECVHCGLCAEGCHHYLSRDRDPAFAPVAKVKDTIWELVKRKGKVDGETIRKMARIAFTECGACRRCSMYCPFGIDIAYLIMTVRRICSLLGVVPQYLQDTTNSHSATQNQMWVQQDEWIDTLQWQEEEAQDEIPSARIPLEKEGADIMYSVIAPEPKILAQLLGNISLDHDRGRPRLDHARHRRLGQQQHGHVLGRFRDHEPGGEAPLGDRSATQGQEGRHG